MKYTSDQPREELVAALIRHRANQRYLIELARIESDGDLITVKYEGVINFEDETKEGAE